MLSMFSTWTYLQGFNNITASFYDDIWVENIVNKIIEFVLIVAVFNPTGSDI